MPDEEAAPPVAMEAQAEEEGSAPATVPPPTTKPLAKSGQEVGPCIMGIDEAGRGPVLGPMVYGAAFCAAVDEAEMATRAFADSKTLKDEQRERLFSEIQADGLIGYAIESNSASDISAQMLQTQRVSLNEIANQATYGLVEAVEKMGYKLSKVFVDTVGDADRHRERLERRFPHITFIVCPKADALYPVVSAASIVAKVTRDHALRDFVYREGGTFSRQFGSGYPSDPVTKAWMKEAMHPLFGFPDLTRFSWQPAARALEDHGPPVQWACDVDEDAQQMAAFLVKPAGGKQRGGGGVTKPASSGAARPPYFRSRRLARLAIAF